MRGTAVLRVVVLCSSLAAFGTAPQGAHGQDEPAAASEAGTGQAPSSDAHAQEIARQHFELGRAQYESGQFRDAAASFERAYELSKREVLWYNIYLAYRDAGDNARAANALRNYLSRVERVENRAHLEARLANLDRLVQEELARAQEEERERAAAAETKQPAPEPAPQVQAETLQAAEDTAPSEPTPSRSIVPYVLFATGGAMVIGGVVTGLMASSKHSELSEQCPDRRCDPALESLADEGETLALTADILLFGGLAVAAAGGVLWFLDDGGAEGEPVAASAGCGTRGCGARVRFAF